MELSHDGLQRAAHDHLLLHFSRNGAFGPGGERAAGARPRRGLPRLGHATAAATSTASRACSAASSATPTAPRWPTVGRARSSSGCRSTPTGRPPTRPRSSWPSAWRASRPRAWSTSSSPAAARRRSSRPGSSCASTTSPTASRERRKAIARRTAYHGVTLGALSFTGVEPFRSPSARRRCRPATSPTRTPTARPLQGAELTRALLDELEQAVLAEGPETVAMIIAEPVQNAGGCFVPPEGYWQGLRELADRHGILLVADEVITGFGRLGEWLRRAHVRRAARPDHGRQGPDRGLRADGRGDRLRARGGAALRGRSHAAARHHLRRPPAGGGDRAEVDRDLRARRRARERARARGPPAPSGWSELRALPIVGDVRGDRLLLGAGAGARRRRHAVRGRGQAAAGEGLHARARCWRRA